MACYIALIDFTEQGVRDFRESPGRAQGFEDDVRNLGVTVNQVYWTLGAHDGALIFEAEDETAATAAMLALAGKGNVRTHTMRAFTAPEFEEICGRTS
ncbi:MAG: GYD family protein [Phycisphaeraceae bacterium]|nr:GYD family protein [Phycisphaeraceae bacterium]